jgi:hypothetical protein
VQPRAVILGNPGYGGSKTALEVYAAEAIKRGATVFRQDQSGAVSVELTGDGILRLRGFLNGQNLELDSAE